MTRLLVNVDVPDLKSGISFFRDGLGLKFERYLAGQVAELSFKDVKIYLLEKEPGSRPASTARGERTYERHWTPVHLDFVVNSIDEALEKAVKFGARIDNSAAVHAWGKIAILSDPFGNGFCLIEFLGRGYDEIVAHR